MISPSRYDKLKKGNTIKSIRIKTHVPSPSDMDYQTGYITRHFIQKVNDENAFIYEISSDDITNYNNSPFYIWVDLDWKISGDRQSIIDANKKSVIFASKRLPKIGLYLPNYLQFSKQ